MKAFLIFLVILIVGCTATQSPTVIASASWPGGWSADGSRLLIGRYHGGSPYVINLSDKAVQPEVASALAGIYTGCVAWTSDEKTILYVDPDPRLAGPGDTRTLRRIDLPDRQTTLLEWNDSIDCPTWSPDNQHIAVGIIMNDRYVLHILDRDGHTERTLFTGMSGRPAWSPDGRTIAITSLGRVTLIDSETGERVNTNAFPRAGVAPTWSPTGEYMAYIEPDMIRSFHFGNLMIAKLDGTRTIVLAGVKDKTAPKDDEFFYEDPSWSPRGDYIAARRIRATEHDFPDKSKYELVVIPVPDNWK